MRHTLTPTQTSNQASKHTNTHRQPHSATVLGKCLTTICACGKRRVRAEAASHADAGAAAGDVLEPYLCLRLVLAFYLFALFVCAVCLPQQSTWNLCADVLAKLPADTHTYTQTKTNPHTHPHPAHHTHTLWHTRLSAYLTWLAFQLSIRVRNQRVRRSLKQLMCPVLQLVSCTAAIVTSLATSYLSFL